MRVTDKGRLALAGALSVLVAAVVAVPAMAAGARTTRKSAAPADAIYRCRDAQGQSYIGQSIPSECEDVDVEVIDGNGRVVRVIPGKASRESAVSRESAEEAAQEAAHRDRTLLATYLAVSDIERLRDQRLELLEQQARVTQQYIVNLKQRQARLARDVQRFRPYNASPNAPVLPDHLAVEIVNAVNSLQIYEQQLAKTTAEQENLRREFAADIARFKELKGLR